MSQFIEMFGDPMVNDKHWAEYRNLNEVADIVLGSTPNSKNPLYWDGVIRWITPAEMTEDSYYIYETERHLTEAGRKAANLTMLPEGAVLFSTRAPIGKVGIVGKEMCCNQGFKNFVCKENMNSVFLYYTLKFKKDYLCSLGTGTTFKELSKRTVESLKIAVPPLEKQKQFEMIYNQADKSEFGGSKSQFIEMFGEKEKNIKNGVLGDFCSLKAGKSVKAEDIRDDYCDGLYPCYGGNGLRGYVSSYSHEGVFNIIGRQGALCGNVTITSNRFYATEHAVVVTPKEEVNTYWLFYALKELNLNQYARGVAQPGLAVNQLEKIPFGVPSLTEQDRFETLYNQADKSEFGGSKSQFIEMFKDEYSTEKWQDCLSITNGKKYEGEYQEAGSFPICGSGGVMGYGERKLCDKDTIILGRKGNINSPIYMENDYWIVDTAFSLAVDRQKLQPKYFFFWCKQFDFTKYNKQGVLPSLTKNDLLKIEMPIPPMEQQTRFVFMLEQADKSEYELRKSIDVIDEVI